MDNEDFVALAALAADPGDGAFLVEVGRRATGAAAGWRLFRSSTSTLIIGVSPDGTRIRIGDTEERGCDVALTRGELKSLAAVSADWDRRRETLWEFTTRRHAFHGPYHYYLPPAGAGKRTEVPGPWRGAEVEMHLPEAKVIAPGAELVADIVRQGEEVAPDVAQIAALYRVRELRITGRRGCMVVERAGARLLMAPADAGLLNELVALVGG